MAMGHHVTGVDLVAHDGVKEQLDRFVAADLEQGHRLSWTALRCGARGRRAEHVRHPEHVLEQLHELLAPSARVIAERPELWPLVPAAASLAGRFDYDRRGILDRDHVRTHQVSLERLLTDSGYRIIRRAATGLPLEVIDRGGHGGAGSSGTAGAVAVFDRATVALRPALFAYQFLYELTPIAAASATPGAPRCARTESRRL